MTRIVALVLGIAITIAVPAILAVTGLRLATNDRYVEAVYDYGAIPGDRYGLSEEARKALALVGLQSILPSSERGHRPAPRRPATRRLARVRRP